MSGDQLFPFPVPDFIFVHNVFVFKRSEYVAGTDERGKTYTALPSDRSMWPASVHGYLTSPDESKDQSGYMQRQNINAVLLLDSSVPIDIDCLIYCDDAQLPAHLAGTYEVDTARPNISHTRVLLRRFRRQWDQYGTDVQP